MSGIMNIGIRMSGVKWWDDM